MEDGKREKATSLLLLFPLPILPHLLSSTPLPSLLTTQKGFWGLTGRREVPQGTINTRHSETSLQFADVDEKIALFFTH